MPNLTREHSQCLFNVIDRSGDGLLSFEELRQGMRKLREVGVAGSASSFWDEANANGDPMMTVDEFHELMTKLSMSLHECAKLGDVEWLQRVLREGACNVNEQQAGGNGYSPLHWAAMNDCTECAALVGTTRWKGYGSGKETGDMPVFTGQSHPPFVHDWRA